MQALGDKYRYDIKGVVFCLLLSTLLLLTNVVGVNRKVYGVFDQLFNPFLISGRNFALNSSTLLKEMSDKSSVLKENIELRREVLQYEQLKAENHDLKAQIQKLEAQTKITVSTVREYQLAHVVGVQNTFSSIPEVWLYLDRENPKLQKGSVVLYDKNTLFGFVSEVAGKTIRVNLFYSPNIESKIPVLHVQNPIQKGFIGGIENGTVKIKNLPKEYKLQENDLWMTTNDVAEVPPSLIVGKVKQINVNQQDGFQDVELTVPFSLSTLSYVLIEK